MNPYREACETGRDGGAGRKPSPRRGGLSSSHHGYRAGERVPAGVYRTVDKPYRQLTVAENEYLPASLDGHVAFYVRVRTWGEATGSKSEAQ